MSEEHFWQVAVSSLEGDGVSDLVSAPCPLWSAEADDEFAVVWLFIHKYASWLKKDRGYKVSFRDGKLSVGWGTFSFDKKSLSMIVQHRIAEL